MMRTYPERPFVGIGAIVFRNEEVLLIRRGKPPREGQWSLPGGIQQLGETVFEAARREVREEAGLEIEVIDVVAVVDAITRDDGGRVKYHYTLVDLLAEWRSGEAVAGDDAAEVAWAACDRLAEFGLWSETARVVHLAAERRGRGTPRSTAMLIARVP